MTAFSYQRGHKIIYKNSWIYADNNQSISVERSCIKCGKMPTKEGYDACLGYIPNVVSACCGHGIYNIKKGKKKMGIKIECNNCGKEISEDNIMCKSCYGDLEDIIYDLKETIKKLEDEKLQK